MKRHNNKPSGIVTLVITLLLVAITAFIVYPHLFPENNAPAGNLPLTFTAIDVGQAEALLIRQGGHTMLIDAGGGKTADKLVKHLQDEGITHFDIIIATHPHEDHIGGMDEIIKVFTVGTFIMPDIINETKTFNAMLDALLEAGITAVKPKTGDVYSLGDAKITIYNDKVYSKSLNDCSVTARLVFANRSIMLMGDAEETVEKDLLASGLPLRSDFLKVAHHGSSTSSSEDFLAAVMPKEAFISVGNSNSYNHPNEVVCYRGSLKETLLLQQGNRPSVAIPARLQAA